METVRLSERPLIRAVLLGFGLWILVRLLERVVWAVVLVLLAIVLATALMPAVRVLRRVALPPRNWRLPEAVAAILVYIGVGLVLGLVGFLVVRSFTTDLTVLLANLPAVAATVVSQADALASSLGLPGLLPSPEDIVGQVQGLADEALEALRASGTVAGGVLAFVFQLFLVLTLSVFLVSGSEQILAFWVSLFPPHQREKVRQITSLSGDRVGRWALGQLTVAAITGTLAGLISLALGLPYAMAIAVTTAALDLAPVLGPGLMVVPVFLLGLWQSPLTAVLAAVSFYLLSQLDGNVLGPLITGRAVQLSPILVIVAITFGLALYGAVGALVAIPVAATLQVVAEEALLPWWHSRHHGPPAPDAEEREG